MLENTLLNPNISTRQLKEAGSILRDCLNQSRTLGCLGPYVDGVAQVFESFGVHVDRVNLPASRLFGFRHPIYSLANLTWLRDSEVQVKYWPHSDKLEEKSTIPESVQGSPYYALFVDDLDYVRFDLKAKAHEFKRLKRLTEDGYADYIAMALCLPNKTIQPMSLASRSPFPEGVEHLLTLLEPLLSSTLDALYQGSAAAHLAQSYIGRITGPKVLAGEFVRGNTQKIEAGILFCDIRGFTALTEKLGGEGVVPVVNCIFDVIGPSVQKYGGEILKFIGDAMLLIFPVNESHDHQAVCTAMVGTVQESVCGVEALGKRLNLPLGIGFGGHVGEVLYGNIGTEQRLDFTVMGSAVNLASRLESLCKKFNASAVFSDSIASHTGDLTFLGQESVKGIVKPVAAWGIRQA